MNDWSGRRWFQVHLSTAIVLMFAASVLIFFNVRAVQSFGCSTTRFYKDAHNESMTYSIACGAINCPGWPISIVPEGVDLFGSQYLWTTDRHRVLALCINFVCGLCVLLLVGWFCEHCIVFEGSTHDESP